MTTATTGMATLGNTPRSSHITVSWPAMMRQARDMLLHAMTVVFRALLFVMTLTPSQWCMLLAAAVLLLGPFSTLNWGWRVLMHVLRWVQSSWQLSGTAAPAAVHTPSTTATPAISGLAPGVTACGVFLITKAAALASASSAAPSVATIASVAFGSEHDLDAVALLPPDWEQAARAVSERVDATIDRFYQELQDERQGLAYGLHLAEDTARRAAELRESGHDERPPSGFVAALWGSELGRRRKLCQRTLSHLLHLDTQGKTVRDGFLTEFKTLDKKLSTLLLPTGGAGHDADNPAAVYQQGIAKLNSEFDCAPTQHPSDEKPQDTAQQKRRVANCESAQRQLVRSLVASASSEQAAFLQDLHTVQGAGNMIHGVVHNAKDRLTKLARSVSKHPKWAAAGTNGGLDAIRRRLEGAETWTELELIAREIADKVGERRGKIQDLYYL